VCLSLGANDNRHRLGHLAGIQEATKPSRMAILDLKIGIYRIARFGYNLKSSFAKEAS